MHACCTKRCTVKHDSDVQEAQQGSAKLQGQLAQKDTDLDSIRKELAHLQQELNQAVNSKDEALQVHFDCVMAAMNSFPLSSPAQRIVTDWHQLL